MSTLPTRSSHLLPLQGVVLGVILVSNWVQTGWLSGTNPQVLANYGYRELWLDHVEGPTGALELFRQALVLDSAFSYRWSDLGEALAGSGQMESAEYCFRRSQELAPRSPQIAVRAMNFYLRRAEAGPALQTAATVLALTSDYDEIVFSSLIRFRADQEYILDVGIGSNRRAADRWLLYLIGPGRTSGADSRPFETWKWIESKGHATREEAIAWSDWLAANGRERDAHLVWQRYVSSDAGYGIGNLIDNAGFEREPEGKGFDWRIAAIAGVKAGIDQGVAHSGRASLRIRFDGSENVDFHHVVQNVWLEPGHYRLSAWMRTEGLTTDQGVAVVVGGVSTAALSGTQDWTKVGAELTVHGAARIGEIMLVRQRSWKFDNKIGGTAWIDDVELRRVD
jgi:hypothetical protein